MEAKRLHRFEKPSEYVIGDRGIFLRMAYQPLYDTAYLHPGSSSPHVLFVDRRRLDGSYKTRDETNIVAEGCLIMPCEAIWRWIKVIVTDYEFGEDAAAIVRACHVHLQVGPRTVFEMGLAAFDPINPNGRKGKPPVVNGHTLRLWPWMIAHIRSQHIKSLTSFKVELRFDSGFPKISKEVRLKVLLGPIYCYDLY